MRKAISPAVIKRLPRYYRYLEELDEKGVKKVSSKDLAEMLDITASQVRQDFCNFGAFGQQGLGYNISNLKSVLASIMGIDKTHNMIVVGAGNIGRAVASYRGFREQGFKIIGMFDIVEKEEVKGIDVKQISELDEFVQNNRVDIAVIAVPLDNAQEVADKIISVGIKNIWNFATIDINVPKNIIVENIFMSDSLYVLSYKIAENENY